MQDDDAVILYEPTHKTTNTVLVKETTNDRHINLDTQTEPNSSFKLSNTTKNQMAELSD